MALITPGSAPASDSHPAPDGVGPMRSGALAVMLLAGVSAAAAEIEPVRAPSHLRAAAIDAVWIGSAATFDLWSTEYALDHGAEEAHPFMRRGLPARVGVKLAMTGVGVAWADHLRRKGDRRGARIVRWGLVGLQVGFAAWNLRQARANSAGPR